ncbi:MAG: glutamine--fructose-6-phosphate aminotransferase, partial [Proteobacteria bacterium]|nr:glutamine--fructose-6-phosphate aminotransferase [Pseudomonadota bacterium]
LLAELRERGLEGELRRRMDAGDLIDGSITGSLRAAPEGENGGGMISFTYKTASIIGALGRNVRELRNQIARDPLFRTFARLPAVFETAFAHTRWASVGSITEENCHPIGNFTISAENDPGGAQEKNYPAYGRGPWTIQVVLNGDIDNYQPLRTALEEGGELIAPEVTTDTKIIPLQIEKYLLQGCDLKESFRRAVSDFEGSHAVAMVSSAEPGKVFLAVKGSGQSIYVGVAPDRYLFSSELYGLVEETAGFVKMGGEKPSRPDQPEATGQIFVLAQDSPGGAAGIEGFFYDGTPLPLGEAAVRKAEITTRDIDRGDYPHFFLKEISEAALSVRKTLRGKYRIEGRGESERVIFNLGEDIVPTRIGDALVRGAIRRITVIGHGTAAVAGMAVADAMERDLRGSGVFVEA